MLHFLRTKRREKLLAEPPPAHWGGIINEYVPHSELLTNAEWNELLGRARIIYSEKKFEGCGGLEVTEEMKVAIAAWGSLLLLGARETDYYPSLESILIYPSSFIVPVHQQITESAQLSQTEVRSGQSCGTMGPGNIILAWDEVLRSTEEFSDGVNVAIHEFAHQLDLSPIAELCTPEFEELSKQVDQGRDDMLLDPYGAVNMNEFLSVVAEQFFEWPRDLREHHPRLYGIFRDYFKQDPAERWDRADP